MNESLFSTESADLRRSTPRGLPLVVTLPGITDAGNAVSGLDEFLWEHGDPRVILRFATDELLDYRARRPLITLKNQRLSDFESPSLVLSVAHDELGKQFLHLSGFEPDYRWEAFVDAVLQLVDEFAVVHTTLFHAVPMPVPHRRPLQFTVSGTREDLLAEHTGWKPTTRLVASVSNVLEYRLQQLGEDVMSWAAMVPHYLSANDYPTAVLGFVSALSKSTGLLFDSDAVRTQSEEFLTAIDAQIAENDDNVEQIRELEARFDRYQHDSAAREELLGKDGEIPSAEELAGEFERFLARKTRPEEDDGPAE